MIQSQPSFTMDPATPLGDWPWGSSAAEGDGHVPLENGLGRQCPVLTGMPEEFKRSVTAVMTVDFPLPSQPRNAMNGIWMYVGAGDSQLPMPPGATRGESRR